MKRFFMAASLVVTCAMLVVPSSAEKMYAVCDQKSMVNIRAKASTNSEVIGYLMNGYDIEVVSIKNGWAYVRCFTEYEYGYVKAEYLSDCEPIEPKEMVVVSNGRVRIRYSANGKATGKFYHDGDRVTVTAFSKGFAKTEKGWVSIDYLEEVK